MTTDGLRGFNVRYNLLNLPATIKKSTDSISYIYAATGEKLAKRMKDNSYQYYAGNMVYNSSKALDYILFEEGMVRNTSGSYTYEYYLKDHLGNTRVVFKQNTLKVDSLQVTDYYPFGSTFNPTDPNNGNKYLYNGKEKQDDVLGSTALDWYDYGARFYDPLIGRWHGLDILSEKYNTISPFNYCLNNPLKFIDLDGKEVYGIFISYSIDYNSNAFDPRIPNGFQIINLNSANASDQIRALNNNEAMNFYSSYLDAAKQGWEKII